MEAYQTKNTGVLRTWRLKRWNIVETAKSKSLQSLNGLWFGIVTYHFPAGSMSVFIRIKRMCGIVLDKTIPLN